MTVDGQPFELERAQQITIEIQGDVGDLIIGACDEVNITGSVGALSVQQGNVKCGEVAGSVATLSGNVQCGDVRGSVSSMSGKLE